MFLNPIRNFRKTATKLFATKPYVAKVSLHSGISYESVRTLVAALSSINRRHLSAIAVTVESDGGSPVAAMYLVEEVPLLLS